ncbi:unnamed protein product [Didymodactylos carnosus]|nr:unnamed protein product [Didymodactylos carnosus]CAF3818568.1 unnamed protein product [Didymodactylos carnosus]
MSTTKSNKTDHYYQTSNKAKNDLLCGIFSRIEQYTSNQDKKTKNEVFHRKFNSFTKYYLKSLQLSSSSSSSLSTMNFNNNNNNNNEKINLLTVIDEIQSSKLTNNFKINSKSKILIPILKVEKYQQDMYSNYSLPLRQETTKSYSKQTSSSSSYSRSSSSSHNLSSNTHQRYLNNNSSLFNNFNDFNDPFFDRFNDNFYFDRLRDDFFFRSPLSLRNHRFDISNDNSLFGRTIPIIKRSSSTSSTGRTQTLPVVYVQSPKDKRQDDFTTVLSIKNSNSSDDNRKGRAIPTLSLSSSDFTSSSPYIPERKDLNYNEVPSAYRSTSSNIPSIYY